jgi:hypothetical protein
MNETTILTKEKLDKNILIKGVCNILGIQMLLASNFGEISANNFPEVFPFLLG